MYGTGEGTYASLKGAIARVKAYNMHGNGDKNRAQCCILEEQQRPLLEF